MAAKGKQRQQEDSFFAVIGDEDTVTGLLLAGVGNVDSKRKANFLVVSNKTSIQDIEGAFKTFTTRDDISILLINQHIANDIRYLLDEYNNLVPTILEIPSKDHPFDPSNDFIMNKISKFTGQGK